LIKTNLNMRVREMVEIVSYEKIKNLGKIILILAIIITLCERLKNSLHKHDK